MFKFILLPLFIFVFGIFLYSPTPVYAACGTDPSTITATPKADGSNVYTVAGTITNCADRSDFRVFSNNPNGQSSNPVSVGIQTDAQGAFSKEVVFPNEGSWDVIIRSATVLVPLTSPVTVNVGTVARAKCGDKVEANSIRCPSNCASAIATNGEWICGGESAPKQPENVNVDKTQSACGITYSADPGPIDHIPENIWSIKFTFSGGKIADGTSYSMKVDRSFTLVNPTSDSAIAKDGKVTLTLNYAFFGRYAFQPGTHKFGLFSENNASGTTTYLPECDQMNYTIGFPNDKQCTIVVAPPRPRVGDQFCVAAFNAQQGSYSLKVIGGSDFGAFNVDQFGVGTKVIGPLTTPQQLKLRLDATLRSYCTSAQAISIVAKSPGDDEPAVVNPQCPTSLAAAEEAPPGCKPGEPGCTTAAGTAKGCPSEDTSKYIRTALGCIPTDPKAFIDSLMVWSAAAGGGVALLLMIQGSLQMMMSQGNAEQLKKGREQFVAAVSGLLFIIFSITLLQIIGVDILNIPGFTR